MICWFSEQRYMILHLCTFFWDTRYTGHPLSFAFPSYPNIWHKITEMSKRGGTVKSVEWIQVLLIPLPFHRIQIFDISYRNVKKGRNGKICGVHTGPSLSFALPSYPRSDPFLLGRGLKAPTKEKFR